MDELKFQKAMEAADAKDACAPPVTDLDLVKDVARAALELRNTRKRLQGFNAGHSSYARAIAVPAASLDAAVERLAAFRGCQ